MHKTSLEGVHTVSDSNLYKICTASQSLPRRQTDLLQFDFYLQRVPLSSSMKTFSTSHGHRLRRQSLSAECYIPLLVTARTFLIHVIHLIDQKGHFFFFDGDRFKITAILDKGGSNFMPILLAYIYHKHINVVHQGCSDSEHHQADTRATESL